MKMNKLSLIAVLAFASLVACSSTASAQTTNHPTKGERRAAGIQQQVDRMASELNLNDEQKTKLAALFEEQDKKRRELRADTSLSKDEQREKFRAMIKEREAKMKQILTPEQFEKWQQHARAGRPPGSEGEKKAEPKKTE